MRLDKFYIFHEENEYVIPKSEMTHEDASEFAMFRRLKREGRLPAPAQTSLSRFVPESEARP